MISLWSGSHAACSELNSNIVTEPFSSKHSQIAIVIEFAGTTVNNTAVKDDAVTGLHVPAGNTKTIRVCFNVWQCGFRNL